MFPLSRIAMYVVALLGFAGVCARGAAPKAGPGAPVITDQPVSRRATQGGPVSFAVAATGSSLAYEWRREAVALTNNARITGATNAVLAIDLLDLPDAGNYSVVVSSTGGSSVTSSVVVLDVTQLRANVIPLGSTGALFTVSGAIGDVYRFESRPFLGGAYITNGYATNFSGTAQFLYVDTGGGSRLFRAGYERLLPVLEAPSQTNTALVKAYGRVNDAWRVQASPDLSAWLTLATVTNLTGTTRVVDPLAGPPRRFYRLLPPL